MNDTMSGLATFQAQVVMHVSIHSAEVSLGKTLNPLRVMVREYFQKNVALMLMLGFLVCLKSLSV